MAIRHRRHANPFCLREAIERPDYTALFGRKAPLYVEIGFGKGQFLIALAENTPSVDIIGLEIRPFLVEEVLAQAQAKQLQNVYARVCNANTALTQLFEPASVARFYIHFPDPWFKNRHQKRRVINHETAQLMRTLLIPGGEIHVMTDYEPIAHDMMRCLQSVKFTNHFGPNQFAPHSTVTYTSEREEWHMSQGDPIYRMQFSKAA